MTLPACCHMGRMAARGISGHRAEAGLRGARESAPPKASHLLPKAFLCLGGAPASWGVQGLGPQTAHQLGHGHSVPQQDRPSWALPRPHRVSLPTSLDDELRLREAERHMTVDAGL